MKPRDIRRGIASRHVRTGDGPDIGKVSRLHGQDHKSGQGRYRRRETRGNPARRRLVKIWSVALGAVAFLVLVVAVFMWLRPQLNRGSGSAAVPAVEREMAVRVASKFPSPSRDEAIRLVKDALANRDPAKVNQLFRTGTSTPEEILGYCAASDDRDGPLDSYEWLSSVDTDGLLVEGVVVRYKGKEKGVERLALLTPDTDGRWRLDFDAFARTVKPGWSELLDGAGEQALVRVIVAPDVYYNGPFRDESLWTCYAMTSPDTEVTLRGYCKVGSPEAEIMKKLFPEGATSSRVTLRISRVNGAEKRQFEISGLLGRDWIVADSPEKS